MLAVRIELLEHRTMKLKQLDREMTLEAGGKTVGVFLIFMLEKDEITYLWSKLLVELRDANPSC